MLNTVNFNEYKYSVLNLKDLSKYLHTFKNCYNYTHPNNLQNRSDDVSDLIAIIGYCRFIKNRNKLIISVKDGVFIDKNCIMNSLSVVKIENQHHKLFKAASDKQFDNIMENIHKLNIIQETSQEGYEESLGLELGLTIQRMITSKK